MRRFPIPGHLHREIQLQTFFRKLRRTLQYYAKNAAVNFFSIERLVSFTCVSLFASIGLNAQPCTLPSRIFLPTADEVRQEQFGKALDVAGEYMVVGSWENSSLQVYSGIVLVYKLDAQNKWTKIAELTPSDPGKYRNFGNRVAISGNSIVVSAREYNDAGISRGKLYIYEKSDGEEWV